MQDKIDSLWSITKIEVKDLKAQLHGKDREAEEIERRHQIELKVVSYSKLNFSICYEGAFWSSACKLNPSQVTLLILSLIDRIEQST